MKLWCNGRWERVDGEFVPTTSACPAYHRASKGDRLGGWTERDGIRICVVSPNENGRELDVFAPYCLATPRTKKIGNPADWGGRTPHWCPLNKEGKNQP